MLTETFQIETVFLQLEVPIAVATNDYNQNIEMKFIRNGNKLLKFSEVFSCKHISVISQVVVCRICFVRLSCKCIFVCTIFFYKTQLQAHEIEITGTRSPSCRR